MSSSYRLELDSWLRALDVKGESVLDIGGSQLRAEGRTRSWDVVEYKVGDLAQPHVDSPKPDLEIDLNKHNVKTVNDYRGYFDIVFCLEVFEYVYNPILALTTIKDLLKKGGVAFITFPSFYPLHQPIEEDSLRYMPGFVTRALASLDLELISMTYRRPETAALVNAWSVERMRAAKHEDHLFTGLIVELKK